jgi:hypothetical protein
MSRYHKKNGDPCTKEQWSTEIKNNLFSTTINYKLVNQYFAYIDDEIQQVDPEDPSLDIDPSDIITSQIESGGVYVFAEFSGIDHFICPYKKFLCDHTEHEGCKFLIYEVGTIVLDDKPENQKYKDYLKTFSTENECIEDYNRIVNLIIEGNSL